MSRHDAGRVEKLAMLQNYAETAGYRPVAVDYLLGCFLLAATTIVLVAVMEFGANPGNPISLLALLGRVALVLAAVAVLIVLAHRSGQKPSALTSADARLAEPETGLLTPFRKSDSATETALRLEQTAHITDQLDVMMGINIVNATLVAISLHTTVDSVLLAGWLGLVLGASALGIYARARSRKRPAPTHASKRTLRRISLHAGVRGLLWGLGFAVFFAQTNGAGQCILLIVAMGMIAGGVPALAPVPAAGMLFGLGILLPTLLKLAAMGGFDQATLALFSLAFSGSMVIISGQLYRNFASNVIMRREQAEQAATISLLLNEFETSASDWLWETDGNGVLVRLPKRMAEVAGLDPASGVPARLDALLTRAGQGDATAIQAHIASGSSFRNLALKLTSQDGTENWVSLTASPKADGGYRGVGSDITAKVHANRQTVEALSRAEKAEQRLKDGIDTLGAGFLLSDRRDRTIIANHSFHTMLPAGSLLGSAATFSDMVAAHAKLWFAQEPEQGRAWAQALLTQRENNAEPFDIQIPGGKWLRVHGRRTSEDGIVTVLTDITDIKEKEAQLAVQARRLTASNNELQQFATVASHDLQEPLRKIEAFGARLKTRTAGKLDADSTMYLERMAAATQRMRLLITDLLSYSRAGRNTADAKPIDLDHVLAGVADDLSIALEERHAIVEFKNLGSMLADAAQMRQLFQNLLSNALKFVKPNVAPKIVIERRAMAAGSVQLRFQDNGIGFDMKHLDKIFEIFQRLHSREQYEGTGIGLATCRKIVERFNGSLTAESAPGEGATFIAIFPASQMVPATAPPATAPSDSVLTVAA